MHEFIKQHNITMTCQAAPKNPHFQDSDNMNHWLCTLQYGNNRMSTYFSQGQGYMKVPANWEKLLHKETYSPHKKYVPAPQSLLMSRKSMHSAFLRQYGKLAEPELADVLDCLASDASGFDNSRSFEEWAGEYGYDTDSRKAEKTYLTVKNQALELKSFLGREAYETLLWNVERE